MGLMSRRSLVRLVATVVVAAHAAVLVWTLSEGDSTSAEEHNIASRHVKDVASMTGQDAAPAEGLTRGSDHADQLLAVAEPIGPALVPAPRAEVEVSGASISAKGVTARDSPNVKAPAGGDRDKGASSGTHVTPGEGQAPSGAGAVESSAIDNADRGARANVKPEGVAQANDVVKEVGRSKEAESADEPAPKTAATTATASWSEAAHQAAAQRNTLAFLRAVVPPTFPLKKITADLREMREETDESRRVTDEMLVRDVTIVVSHKEALAPVRVVLPALRAVLPSGISIVIISTGPCNSCRDFIRAWTDELVRTDAAFNGRVRILHAPDFKSSSTMRRQVGPSITTKYALFINNDVFPATPQSLRELYAAAEWTHTAAHLYLPFIAEVRYGSVGGMHGGLTGLWFAVGKNGVATRHIDVNETRRHALKETSHSGVTPQPSSIEDHVFFMRDPARTSQALFDPSASLTTEYLDMAMNMRYAGLSIVDSFTSWWALALTDIASADDMPFVAWRRSDYMAEATISYISRKWKLSMGVYSGFHSYFRANSMRELVWSRGAGTAPTAPCDALSLAASMLALIGFNTFDVTVQGGGESATASGAVWHLAYHPMIEACGIARKANAPMSVSSSLAIHKVELTDVVGDAAARSAALHSGRLFTVQRKNAEYPLSPPENEPIFFPDIAVVHVRGVPADRARDAVDTSSVCWSRDGGATVDCVAWMLAGDAASAEPLATLRSLSATSSNLCIIRRDTPGRPLDLISGPPAQFALERVAYLSAEPSRVAAAFAKALS